jgi:hypothetical protein
MKMRGAAGGGASETRSWHCRVASQLRKLTDAHPLYAARPGALLGIAPGLFVIIYGHDSSCATVCIDWRLYGDADASAVLTHCNTGRLRSGVEGHYHTTLSCNALVALS